MKIIKYLLCRLFGHRYKILRKISTSITEVECTRCEKQFGMNHKLKVLLPLDDELRRAHEVLKSV